MTKAGDVGQRLLGRLLTTNVVVRQRWKPSWLQTAASGEIVTTMLIAVLIAAAAQTPAPAGIKAAFSQSYGVWVSVDGGACTYWLTDVGLDARQLSEALKRGYNVKRGAEILTSADTPARCVKKAGDVIKKAGFSHVQTRPGTDRDRLRGIP